MNIDKKSANLYNSLVGKVPVQLLYKEVFGMTEDEANSAYQNYLKERVEMDDRVASVYIAKARNDARKKCGFREKGGEDVKPMPTHGIMKLMGVTEEPQPDEEEL